MNVNNCDVENLYLESSILIVWCAVASDEIIMRFDNEDFCLTSFLKQRNYDLSYNLMN